jgi:hypothetical protein
MAPVKARGPSLPERSCSSPPSPGAVDLRRLSGPGPLAVAVRTFSAATCPGLAQARRSLESRSKEPQLTLGSALLEQVNASLIP